MRYREFTLRRAYKLGQDYKRGTRKFRHAFSEDEGAFTKWDVFEMATYREFELGDRCDMELLPRIVAAFRQGAGRSLAA